MILAHLYTLLAPVVRQIGTLPRQAFAANSSLNVSAFTPEGSQVTLAAPALHLDCNPEQDFIIDQAREQFTLLARGTWKWYNAIQQAGDADIREDARKTHAYWFGDITRPELPDLYKEYNRVLIEQDYKNAVNGQNDAVGRDQDASPLAFQCGVDRQGEGECNKDIFGITPSGGTHVKLCPLFFKEPVLVLRRLKDSKKDSLSAGTIAHEITHSKRLIGVGVPPIGNIPSTKDIDVGYGWDNCHNAAKGSVQKQQDAILNADNYLYYFQRSYYQYCQCSPYEGTRENPSDEKRQICHALWDSVDRDKGEGCTIS